MQYQVAQTFEAGNALSFFCRKTSPFRHQLPGFRSKIIGVQVVRTPASANVDLGSRGAYPVAVGIERVQ